MNNNIFYSIIIPVYNNSISDVYRCIDSLYRDILTNFEILLMDDGSEAGFARELDILAEKYSGIRVFHLPHKGASNARNEGILQASGKYLCFCDADDCVTKQFLFDLENYRKSNLDYDIVYGLVKYVKKEETIKIDIPLQDLQLQAITNDYYKELYRHMFDLGSQLFKSEVGYVNRGPVARIIKRTVCKACLFDTKLVLGEDEVWNLDLLEHTSNLAIVNHRWYLYIENPWSTSRKPNPKFIEQHRNLLVSKLPYMKKHKGSLEGAFANRTFQSLQEIIKGYFLTHKNENNFLDSLCNFNKMTKEYPYSIIGYKDAIRGGNKTFIKFIIMKSGGLLLFYKLKQLLFQK